MDRSFDFRHGQHPVGNPDELLLIDQGFRALADPLRRRLMVLLGSPQHFCRRDRQVLSGICVQDLASLTGRPQSTVSRHLAVLQQAGLVTARQDGPWHYYQVEESAIRRLSQWLEEVARAAPAPERPGLDPA
jgi:DNA-binding transcriptional ArsR family regulator